MAAVPSQFGPYQVIAPLGSGGMGVVYRARDPRLQRDVAIKVLPPHRRDDPDALARLVRESRAVAAVAHPAILTIHDVGDQDDHFYLVTELLEGETCRQRLARGPLPWRQALDDAAVIASALAAAHAQGLVHRDLKPENLFRTTSGIVKVLDFGIAKFVHASESTPTAAGTLLTHAGSMPGTVGYTAPEQIDGRAIDHRADQFSFGVVLHEMLTGERPFKGTTPMTVAAAILRDEPPSLTTIRPDLPAPLATVITRCLSKDRELRYSSTADLASALENLRDGLDASSKHPRAVVTARSTRRPRAIAAAAAAALAIALSVISFRETPPASSDGITGGSNRAIAVLPFTTIGDEQIYLADGLTETVTRELGQIEGMRVIASNSAFAYRGRTEGFSRIGQELGVTLMVRGTVQRAGPRVRVNAALIDTRRDTTLWTQQYEREFGDIFAVQDDIAWQVATKLAATFGSAAPPRPPERPQTGPEAYDAYLRGVHFLRKGSATTPDAIRELERAVALDPSFGLARARLASAYTQQFFYNATDPSLEQRAFVEIERALALNPDQAEAYLARAQLIWNLRNGFPHERTIADLRRAVAHNPNMAEAHVELGKLYYHIGLIDKSIAANEKALKLDPLADAAARRMLAAEIDGAMTEAVRDSLLRHPQMPVRSRSTALAFLHQTDEAIKVILASAPDLQSLDMNDAALLAQLYARSGRRANAEHVLDLAIPLAANPTGLSDTHHAQFAIGATFALLGKLETAMEWLTKAANEGYPSFPRYSSEPDLAALKRHPGFTALLERLRQDFERWRRTL